MKHAVQENCINLINLKPIKLFKKNVKNYRQKVKSANLIWQMALSISLASGHYLEPAHYPYYYYYHPRLGHYQGRPATTFIRPMTGDYDWLKRLAAVEPTVRVGPDYWQMKRSSGYEHHLARQLPSLDSHVFGSYMGHDAFEHNLI